MKIGQEFRPSTFASTMPNRVSSSFNSALLSMTMTAGRGNIIGTWDTRGYVLRQEPNLDPPSTANEILNNVPNGKLLFVDAWLDSLEGGTANNHLPVTRVGFQTDIYGETGVKSPKRLQGRTAYLEFRGWNRTDAEDVGQSVSPVLALGTTAKRYTAVMEPQIRTGSTIDCRPFIQFWSFPTTFSGATWRRDDLDAGTVRIRRVVVTQYDLPALP